MIRDENETYSEIYQGYQIEYIIFEGVVDELLGFLNECTIRYLCDEEDYCFYDWDKIKERI